MDKYGLCRVNFSALCKTSNFFKSAINKHDYFVGKLKLINPAVYNEIKFFTIKYQEKRKNVEFMSKNYGMLSMKPLSLLSWNNNHNNKKNLEKTQKRYNGAVIDFYEALDKTLYFKMKGLEVHGDKFSYDKSEKIKCVCVLRKCVW